MNKKIGNLFISITLVTLFCFATLVLFIWLFITQLLVAILLFVFFYFLNFACMHNNFSKKRISSQAKISWTITLTLLPFYGAIFYYIGGYASKKYYQKLENLFLLERENVDDKKYTSHTIEDEVFNKNLNFLNHPTITNSSFKIYDNSLKKFDNLISDLKSATKFINMQYFIINDGIIWKQIEKILIEKANSGIDVKVLVDYFGCVQTKDKVFDNLRKSKVNFSIFSPTRFFLGGGYLNHRMHNKFVIIDNRIVYFGGMNIGDDYANLYPKYGKWFDLQIAYEGEIVNEMNNHFITQWFFSTNEKISHSKIIPISRETNMQFFADGPNYNESTFINYLVFLINNSKRAIRIVTAYIVIPKEILNALIKAKERGVEIEFITAGIPDKRTAYEIAKIHIRNLLNLGIKVYRMQNSFIHSKFYLFDDDLLITGTTNMDYRAIYLHFESNLVIKDKEMYKELENLFALYKDHSYKLKHNQYNGILYALRAPFYYFFSGMF